MQRSVVWPNEGLALYKGLDAMKIDWFDYEIHIFFFLASFSIMFRLCEEMWNRPVETSISTPVQLARSGFWCQVLAFC